MNERSSAWNNGFGTMDGVDIEFPADERYLQVARATAAAVAMVHDLTLDDIADVRLAIDEVCATLIPLAAPHARAHCVLEVDDRRLRLTARVLAAKVEMPDPDSVGWRILNTLADFVTTHVEEHAGNNGTQPLVMTVIKQRTKIAAR